MLRFFILFLIFSSIAVADSGGSHTITIKIPQVLVLELSDQQGSKVNEAISVKITDNTYQLSPSSSSLRVLANTDWQLNAQILNVPTEFSSVQHKVHLNGQSFKLSTNLQALISNASTQGWKTLDFAYSLENLLAFDAQYQVTIRYSLTQP